jgi:hypothetical protein
LTNAPLADYVAIMKTKVEPMQQAVRKIVGRPPVISRRLAHLEDLAAFLIKHSHEAITRHERELVPVRKIVGRPRGQRN